MNEKKLKIKCCKTRNIRENVENMDNIRVNYFYKGLLKSKKWKNVMTWDKQWHDSFVMTWQYDGIIIWFKDHFCREW